MLLLFLCFLGSPNVLDFTTYYIDVRKLCCLKKQPIRMLISVKWNIYKYVFLVWALLHFGIMIAFTVFCYKIPDMLKLGKTSHERTFNKFNFKERNLTLSSFCELMNSKPNSFNDIELLQTMCTESVRLYTVLLASSSKLISYQSLEFFKVVIILKTIMCIVYLLFEIIDIYRSLNLFVQIRIIPAIQLLYLKRPSSYSPLPWQCLWKPDGYRLLLALHSVITLLWFSSKFELNSISYGELAISQLTGWYTMLFFSQVAKPIGFFTIMVNRVIFGDLLRFLTVLFVIVIGFSSAINILMQTVQSEEGVPEKLATIRNSFYTMFRIMIGVEDYDFVVQSPYSFLIKVFYIMFVVLTTVMLMNMLIAQIGDTYAMVAIDKDIVWLKLRCSVILLLERRMPYCLKRWLTSRHVSFENGRWMLTFLKK